MLLKSRGGAAERILNLGGLDSVGETTSHSGPFAAELWRRVGVIGVLRSPLTGGDMRSHENRYD